MRAFIPAFVFCLMMALCAVPLCSRDVCIYNPDEIVQEIFSRLADQSDGWFHQGDYLRSIQVFRMAIAADDQDLESYYLSAWLLWSSGREEEAQDTYLQAVRSAPDNYSPYNEIGMHYMGRRDYEKAALWLTHACLHDAPAQTWKSLAHSYRHLGLKEDALKVLLYADKLDPYDPAIKRNIGWLLDDFGEQ